MKKSRKKGKEALDEALLKVAVGYSVEEVTEEYAEVDGEMKLMKRKETKKDIPPDLKAVQMLLADSEIDFSKMSDEALIKERDRLLLELEGKKAGGVKEKATAESKSTAKVTKGKPSVGKSKKGAGKSTAKKNKGAKA